MLRPLSNYPLLILPSLLSNAQVIKQRIPLPRPPVFPYAAAAAEVHEEDGEDDEE